MFIFYTVHTLHISLNRFGCSSSHIKTQHLPNLFFFIILVNSDYRALSNNGYDRFLQSVTGNIFHLILQTINSENEAVNFP